MGIDDDDDYPEDRDDWDEDDYDHEQGDIDDDVDERQRRAEQDEFDAEDEQDPDAELDGSASSTYRPPWDDEDLCPRCAHPVVSQPGRTVRDGPGGRGWSIDPSGTSTYLFLRGCEREAIPHVIERLEHHVIGVARWGVLGCHAGGCGFPIWWLRLAVTEAGPCVDHAGVAWAMRGWVPSEEGEDDASQGEQAGLPQVGDGRRALLHLLFEHACPGVSLVAGSHEILLHEVEDPAPVLRAIRSLSEQGDLQALEVEAAAGWLRAPPEQAAPLPRGIDLCYRRARVPRSAPEGAQAIEVCLGFTDTRPGDAARMRGVQRT